MPKKKTKKKSKSKTSPLDKQTYTILGIMALILVSFILALTIIQSTKTFDYNGITFTKQKQGDVKYFQYRYLFEEPAGVVNEFFLNIHKDPRKNNIPVEGDIELAPRAKLAYISIDASGLEECEDSRTAVAGLANFFSGNHYNLKSGALNQIEAEANNLSHITCETRPSQTVIQIKQGEQTKIIKSADTCYTIEIANCEFLLATEKFQVQTILDAIKRNS